MKLNINGNVIEVADEEISKAIEEKQEAIEIKADLVIRTKEDEAKFSENKRTEGISIGAEIGRKEVIKGLGIEGEGLHKSDDSAINAIKTFAESKITKALSDAKIEPDKKNKELLNDLSTLKNTVDSLTKEKEELNNKFKTFKNNQLISSSLSNEIPDNVLLPKNDTLTLMQSKIKLDVNENGQVYGLGADGQPLKDPTTLELLPVKNIVQSFFNENNQLLKTASGGAGGGDSSGGAGKQSIDDFTKEMQDAGHAPNSPQFNTILNERVKAGTIDI